LDKTLRCFDVRHAVDLYAPRRAVRDLATTLGFSSSDSQELAIVVSELVSNILKYGVRGAIGFVPVESHAYGAGILIVARDEGPPFHNLELALRDGFNDRGPIDPVALFKRSGIGAGMGAIVRLTDEFQLGTVPNGKEIRVARYRLRPRRR
jgi:serine/threonine-protein kinase RsbT